MEILFDPVNHYFIGAFILLVGIGLVEAIALMGGMGGLGAWIDDFCLHHVEVPDSDGLGWLFIGKLPFLIVLVIFLSAFGASGLVLQSTAHRVLGSFLESWLAVPLAGLAAVLAVRWIGRGLLKHIPPIETTAISLDELVGHVGVIITGTARKDSPAPAKVRDRHGRTHYVRVEPEYPEQVFPEKLEVLLIRRVSGNHFVAVANPSAP